MGIDRNKAHILSINRSFPEPYSSAVYISSSCPFLLRLSMGSARISTPGPTRLLSPLRVGKICVYHRQPKPIQTSLLLPILPQTNPPTDKNVDVP